MVGLDLTGVAGFVEGLLLVDDLICWRTNGRSDDVLDEETGALTPAPGVVVWAGKGAVFPIRGYSGVQSPDTQRVLNETDARHFSLVSVDVTEDIRPGDWWRTLVSNQPKPDPLLSTRLYEVVELGSVSSLSVVRFVYLKQWSTIPADLPVPELPGGEPWPTFGGLVEDPDNPGFYIPVQE